MEQEENSVVTIFEAIGDLETVLARLRSVAPEMQHEAEELLDIQEGIIDDTLDRGDDLALDQALETDPEKSVDALPGSDVAVDEDSSALEQSAASEEATEAGPLGKQIWRKIFRPGRRKTKKKYLCATRPQIKSTRKGKRVWYSMIRYKRQDSSEGQLFRVIGRDPNHKPQSVTLQGRKLRWC